MIMLLRLRYDIMLGLPERRDCLVSTCVDTSEYNDIQNVGVLHPISSRFSIYYRIRFSRRLTRMKIN